MRSKANIAITIIAILYLTNLGRLLLLESYSTGVVLSYIIFAAAIAAAGVVSLILIAILYLVAHRSTETAMSSSARSLVFWALVIIGGSAAYNLSPLYAWINAFVHDNLHAAAYHYADFAARLAPFDTIGVLYAGLLYAAIGIMLFASITTAILDDKVALSEILSAIAAPLIVCGAAVVLSLINHEYFGLHLLWAVLFFISIFGLHKTFADATEFARTEEAASKKGPGVYLRIKDMATMRRDHPIDTLASFFAVGLTLLAQIAMVVAFIVYMISNFGYILGAWA